MEIFALQLLWLHEKGLDTWSVASYQHYHIEAYEMRVFRDGTLLL